jgi:hypothetical protein
MHRRQGYLDGEDQKTLISFVLYGDPLAQAGASSGLTSGNMGRKKSPKGIHRFPAEAAPQVKTICDRTESSGPADPLPQDVVLHVKNVVEQYLPGMRDAHICLSHEHAECNCSDHTCPTSQLGPKARPTIKPERRVVTLSKQLRGGRHIHPAYARLTFDKEGKIVKLAVSR